MAEQEFLASFGVEIDESGVRRLQEVLTQNREQAEELAAAFDRARAAVQGFFRELSELPFTGLDMSTAARVTEQPEGISVPFSLDLTKASQELNAFFKTAGKAFRLNADASGIVSAGRNALSELQSLFASTTLRLRAQVEETTVSAGDGEGTENGDSGGSGDSGTSGDAGTIPSGSSSGDNLFAATAKASTGGRFDERTVTEVAEDGEPEYVIPVRKESLAVPLLRQLMGEMSPEAQRSLRQSLPEEPDAQAQIASREPQETETFTAPDLQKHGISDAVAAVPVRKEETAQPWAVSQPNLSFLRGAGEIPAASAPPDLSFLRRFLGELSDSAKETLRAAFPGKEREEGDPLASLPDLLASARETTTQVYNQQSSNVSAPVSIQVTASGSDPQAVGRSVYDVTEQYLLRTLKNSLG